MLLYAAPGTGSTLAEIALDWAGVAYKREVMTWEQVQARSHAGLLAANPLHQLPTLILDNGQVLTESAAIVLWLDEAHPQAGLLPPPGSAERVHALRRSGGRYGLQTMCEGIGMANATVIERC